jgi:DNA repair photolyase
MTTRATVTIGRRGQLITATGFKNYDVCMNPYVGCEFGCTYCYVRFFIKDDKKDWGEFVRVRAHMADKLPKELRKNQVKLPAGSEKYTDEETGKTKTRKLYRYLPIPEARLVIGTMTDPYQPAERKHRVTRAALKVLTQDDLPHFEKIGLFTRSPIVLDDLELIQQLPKARIHFTVTPFPPDVLRAIEPYSSITSRRWDTVKKLKDAGLRVHCNISPIIPGLSEEFIEEFAEKVAELQVDEYFVDPMQPYKESFESFRKACQGLPDVNWLEIEQIMNNRDRYLDWKADFFGRWNEERQKHQHKAPDQLPIWCDHENKVWINMLTMKQMDPKHYGEEAKT